MHKAQRQSPLISIIIPTYKREHTLKRAIDSVFSQSYKNFELIVVDDGPTNETKSLVTSYDRTMTLLQHTTNQGVSCARNTGIFASRGDYICFLDSDDEWLPHKLETQIGLIKKKDYRLVHGEEIWMRRGQRVNPKKIHQKYGGWIFERCLSRCLISPSSVMIERKTLLEFRGLDESFPVCEDYDLWLKMTSRYEVGFVEKPLIIKYGGHSDQLSRKYKAMDYYRVLALNNIKNDPFLTSEQKLLVAEEIRKKATILIAGYIKHNNTQHLQEIREILERISLSFSEDLKGQDAQKRGNQ